LLLEFELLSELELLLELLLEFELELLLEFELEFEFESLDPSCVMPGTSSHDRTPLSSSASAGAAKEVATKATVANLVKVFIGGVLPVSKAAIGDCTGRTSQAGVYSACREMPDREQDLDQPGPDQPLRRNRGAAEIGVELLEFGIQAGQRVVHHLPELAQRMQRRSPSPPS